LCELQNFKQFLLLLWVHLCMVEVHIYVCVPDGS